jgi:ankyrin repeat protein
MIQVFHYQLCIDAIQTNDRENFLEQIKKYPQLIHEPIPLRSVRNDWTLLLLVANADFEGSLWFLNTLLESGSNIDTLSSSGLTALMYSAYRSDVEKARCLLQYGANTSIRGNPKKQTAFELAMERNVQTKEWINLFQLHKDQLDEKDLALLHEHRLLSLYAN